MAETKVTGADLVEEGIPTSDLEPDRPVKGQVDGRQVIVVRTSAGICAVAGSCTHYGGPLGDGLCVDGQVRCPWHHARFDLLTGEAVGAPALDSLRVYQAEERDGRVFVNGPIEPPVPERVPPVKPESVVIVGSGAAGAAAAEMLRREGYLGPVTLIGVEPPIDRPNVSKDYLAGTAPEDWMPLRSPDFYEEHGITLMTGIAVTAIDTEQGTVTLEDGRSIPYGALLLAPGAEPVRLPIPGADLPHVHYVRTLEDSRSIIAGLPQVRHAVVIGAGFIGLETAASLRHRQVPVTVVAPEEVPLAGVIGQRMGAFVHALHEEHGVGFRLGRTVAEIHEGNVVLDDGEPLETEWHVLQFPLLRRLIRQAMAEQGRTDFYTGANMFVYYSLEQAWEVAQEVAQGLEPPEQKAFRGPDVFSGRVLRTGEHLVPKAALEALVEANISFIVKG